MCQQRVKKVAMRRDCEKEHEGDRWTRERDDEA